MKLVFWWLQECVLYLERAQKGIQGGGFRAGPLQFKAERMGQCGLCVLEVSIPILPHLGLKIPAEFSWHFLFQKKHNDLKPGDHFVLQPKHGRGGKKKVSWQQRFGVGCEHWVFWVWD